MYFTPTYDTVSELNGKHRQAMKHAVATEPNSVDAWVYDSLGFVFNYDMYI